MPIHLEYHTINPERISDIEIPDSSDSYTGRDYSDVRREFQKAGFSNITLAPKYDLSLFRTAKKGEIQFVSINGSNTFAKGGWVPSTTEVTITYHAEDVKYIGKNYLDVESSLKEMGFTTRLNPLNDLSAREMKKDGSVESVSINGNDFSNSTELNLLDTVIISYHSEKVATSAQVKVTVASKKLIGKDYAEVVESLKNMGFTDVNSSALADLSNEWFTKAGTVKSIIIGDILSFDEGDIFDKNANITVSYHSLKDS